MAVFVVAGATLLTVIDGFSASAARRIRSSRRVGESAVYRPTARPRPPELRAVPASTATPTTTTTLAATTTTITTAPQAATIDQSQPNVLKRWAATMGGGEANQVLTLEGAQQNARNYDLVAGLPRTMGPYLGAMRAVNPTIKLIAYLNGAYAMKSQIDKYPEDWYARDGQGRKITATETGNFLMDVSHEGWVASRVAECAKDMQDYPFDGCYVDMLGGATLEDGYASAKPINPKTGAVWTVPDFMAATSALAASVRAGNAGSFIVANGLSNGQLYFDPASGPSARLLDGIQGGNAQGWIRGTSQAITKFRREGLWKKDVDMLVHAASRGRSVFTMTKIWNVPATPEQRAAVHRYALASFLLGTDGTQYFFFSDTDGQAAVAPDYAYDHVNVGMPVGPYAKAASGVYTRTFSAGVAVVNPTSNAITYKFETRHRNLDGAIVRGKVQIPPYSGDVYVPA